ncbi:MAG: hypothetical protein HY832_02995 [Candidatus Aenigmarchaeota archaeon]|nr:hypothetical protein [Candidatus Aenigmarchaeota archaeon]
MPVQSEALVCKAYDMKCSGKIRQVAVLMNERPRSFVVDEQATQFPLVVGATGTTTRIVIKNHERTRQVP